jgi:hypothetical protein
MGVPDLKSNHTRPFWAKYICSRCGEPYTICPHLYTHRPDITPAHALRIKAAYAIGKRCNPDHDTTSYFLQTMTRDEARYYGEAGAIVGPLGSELQDKILHIPTINPDYV